MKSSRRHVARWTLIPLVLAACADAPSTNPRLRRRGSSSSGSSSGSSSEPIVGAGESLHEMCWSTINEYRKSIGLAPYERWIEAEACSDESAKRDAERNQPHGSLGNCGEVAQNECPGNPGPAKDGIPVCLAMMWDEGPGGGHYDSMTSTRYKKAACGVFVTESGAFWSVQNFR